MLTSKGDKMKNYTSPEFELIVNDCNDVVTTSVISDGEINEPIKPGIELPDDDLTK